MSNIENQSVARSNLLGCRFGGHCPDMPLCDYIPVADTYREHPIRRQTRSESKVLPIYLILSLADQPDKAN